MDFLPKFSVRHLFVLLAVASLILLFASDAYQGGAIGTAMSASVVLLIPCLLVMSLVYWIGWAVSKLEQAIRMRRLRRPPYQVSQDPPYPHESTTQSTSLVNPESNKSVGLLVCGLTLTGWLSALSANPAFAIQSLQYSSQAAVALNRTYSPNALSIVVDDQFPCGSLGMRMVRVTIETYSQLPVRRDQDFTICFDPPHRYYREVGVNFFKHVTIPAGDSSVSTEIYLAPNISRYNERMTIGRGRWNGIPSNRQRVFSHMIGRQGNTNPSLLSPTLLISSAVDPSLGVRRFIADQGENQGESIIATNVKQDMLPDLNGLIQIEVDDQTRHRLPSLNLTSFHACHPDDLPRSWIGLSSIERIFITASELEDLIENAPFHRLTISSWLAAGGALVVLDAGDSVADYNKLVAKLTHPVDSANSPSSPSAVQRKWKYPTPIQTRIVNRLTGLEVEQGHNQYYYTQPSSSNKVAEEEVVAFLNDRNLDNASLWKIFNNDSAPEAFPAFMLTDHNRGQVVMVAAETGSWSLEQWKQLANSIQLQGIAIRGMVLSNQQTYTRETFAIEGVGEPPLMLFQILMTLFVIVAGPVVFIVLKRSRNLQLMFLIVPAISLTACLGMVGNAVFLEGFGSQGRVDSVTWLDHRSNSAVSQVRACYYHGRDPGAYEFFSDTLPMDFQRTELSPSSSGFRIHLKPESTSISGGNFQSRTPHQVVSLRSYQLGRQLHWQADENQPSGTFQNGLETALRLVIARNETGWVIAENLAAGQSVAGVAISEEQLTQKLSQLAQTMSPRFYQNIYSQNWSRSYRRASSNLASTQANLGGEFDVISALQSSTSWQGLVPENGYLVICDSLPYLDSQLVDSPSPQLSNQLHVVIGKW